MRNIEKIELEEAQKWQEEGTLLLLETRKRITTSEKTQALFTEDTYLQKTATQLHADIVGMPKSTNESYHFYKFNNVISEKQAA